jgi:hypothetical protein
MSRHLRGRLMTVSRFHQRLVAFGCAVLGAATAALGIAAATVSSAVQSKRHGSPAAPTGPSPMPTTNPPTRVTRSAMSART